MNALAKISVTANDIPGGSEKSFAIERQRAVDLWAFKRDFKPRWARYLKDNFTGPVHVAHVFGCTERTATYWMDETTAPKGEVVALFFVTHPEAIEHFFAGAA